MISSTSGPQSSNAGWLNRSAAVDYPCFTRGNHEGFWGTGPFGSNLLFYDVLPVAVCR